MAVVQSKEAVSQTSLSTCSAKVQLLVLYLLITFSSPCIKQRAVQTQAVHRAALSSRMAISTLPSHPGPLPKTAPTMPHSQCPEVKESYNSAQVLLVMMAQPRSHNLPASLRTPITCSLQICSSPSRPKEPARSASRTVWRLCTSLDRSRIHRTCPSISTEYRISRRRNSFSKSPVQALGSIKSGLIQSVLF